MLTRQQKVSVQRVHPALWRCRQARRHQGLAQHLPAKQGGRANVVTLGHKTITLLGCQAHQFHQAVHIGVSGRQIGQVSVHTTTSMQDTKYVPEGTPE